MSRTRARTTSLAATFALAVLAASATVVPSASAAVPSAPAGMLADTPNSTTTVLSWERATGAANYTVQVDDDPGFRTPEYNQTTTNVSAVPHTALKAGTNHWRVQAANRDGKSEWSVGSFHRPDPQVPQLQAPANGATLSQPDEPPLLQWGSVQGAKSYTIEVDDAEDFIGAKSWTTSTTSLVPNQTLQLGQWYWRVTATDAGGQLSAPSAPRSFTIPTLPAPRLVSPTNSANEELEDVVLDWDPVPGATSYELQVAVNSGFERTDIIANVKNVRGTRWSPAGGLDNDQYYWRVRAVDPGGAASAWAASPYNFARTWQDRPWPVSPAQPGFPTYPSDFDTSKPNHRNHAFYPKYVRNYLPSDPDVAGLPEAVITSEAPFLQWTPVQHASYYELDLGTDANFSPNTFVTCQTVGTTFTPHNARHRCRVREGTTYYWRVRPMDMSLKIEGIYSPTQKFTWQPGPEWVTHMAPGNGDSTSTPTFSWRSRVASAQYQITVTDRQQRPVASGTTRATSWTAPTELDPSGSPFTWTLTAFPEGDEKSLIRSRTFTLTEPDPVSSTIPPLTALTGLATDPASRRAPELSWTPHPDAAYYKVFFGPGHNDVWWVPVGDEQFGRKLHYPRMTDTGVRMMTPGEHKWRVEAYSDEDVRLGVSATNKVNVARVGTVTGQRIALEGLTLSEGNGCALPLDSVSNQSQCPEAPTTPVFAWDPVPDAAYYMLYVSYDRNFTNLTHPPTRIPSTYSTMYSFSMHGPEPMTLPDNTSGVPYYWHVRACTAPNICGPDPISAATTLAVNAFKKVSPQVQTIGTSATVDSSEITFAWEDYHESNQRHRVTRDGAPSWSAKYHRPPAAGAPINPRDLSNQSAAKYRIRVATDANFNNVIDDQVVDQTTYTAIGKLYPEGPKYWRVSAIDNANNELSTSATKTFVKASARVPVLSPAPNASVAGTTPFRWKGMPFTGKYEIEVSRNDPQFSSVNRYLLATTWATAYTPVTPLPVSETPYYWRVRRVDASNNPTTWSSGVPFRVVSQGVTLTGPAAGSTQVPNGPLLTWQPLTEATTYLVEVKDATGKVVASQVTPATSYATATSLAAGRHTWSVTARNSDGKALAAPSVRAFVVDTALQATTNPVIGHATPRPEVGSTLSVAPLSWNRAGVQETHQWLRDGSGIRNATSSTYEVTEADFGKNITVRVKGTLAAYADTEITSAPVLIGPGSAVIASAPPQISGRTQVGQQLSSTTGSWPDKTKVTYQWLRNGTPISGATASTYTLQMADAVTRISVRTTGTLAGRTPGTATSSTVTVPKAKSTTTAKLSAKKVKRGKKVKMTVTVTVPGAPKPTGKLIVKVGKKKIKTMKLKAGKNGKVTFALPMKKLKKKGKHRLVVQYKGPKKIANSKSKRVVLRIT